MQADDKGLKEPGETRKQWMLTLLAAHEAAMSRYAARLLKDREKARDLVQETFLRLWKATAAEVGDNPPAWLYTVLRHLCFDHLRKERRMIAFAPDDLPAEAAEAAQAVGEDERQDGWLSVAGVLAKLPAAQQEVIRLKFQSGLSYKDISRITGHSVSHVGVLIHTGVKALRAAMAPAANTAAPRGPKGGAL